MKKIKFIILAVITILIYTSCQQMFTYSTLEWAQRDPANLSPAQQIVYAEQALASGDQDAIEAAFAAISSSTDPNTQALASQLAVSASGLDEAITEAITTMTFDPSVISTIDGNWLDNAEAAMLEADTGGADITPEEYLTIAAAIIVLDAQNNHGGDISSVIFTGTADQNSANENERALYYAEAAGYTQADFESMFGI